MYCAVMKQLLVFFAWLANLSSFKQLHVGKERMFLSQKQNDNRILLVNLFLNLISLKKDLYYVVQLKDKYS